MDSARNENPTRATVAHALPEKWVEKQIEKQRKHDIAGRVCVLRADLPRGAPELGMMCTMVVDSCPWLASTQAWPNSADQCAMCTSFFAQLSACSSAFALGMELLQLGHGLRIRILGAALLCLAMAACRREGRHADGHIGAWLGPHPLDALVGREKHT